MSVICLVASLQSVSTTLKIDNNNGRSSSDSWEQRTMLRLHTISLPWLLRLTRQAYKLSLLQIEGRQVWEVKGLDQHFPTRKMPTILEFSVWRHTFCTMVTLSALWKLSTRRWKSRWINWNISCAPPQDNYHYGFTMTCSAKELMGWQCGPQLPVQFGESLETSGGRANGGGLSLEVCPPGLHLVPGPSPSLLCSLSSMRWGSWLCPDFHPDGWGPLKQGNERNPSSLKLFCSGILSEWFF